MKDEQMQSLLDAWYRDRDEAPRDTDGGSLACHGRVPQTRQRSRWWPFPIFYRRTKTPPTTDTAEYQPSPIPATDGHTPTVIGRTQSMLSPVKAITAGAIIFAIGGVMLVAQPFQQQGSPPGAATPAAPVAVSGHATGGDCPVEPPSSWATASPRTGMATATRHGPWTTHASGAPSPGPRTATRTPTPVASRSGPWASASWMTWEPGGWCPKRCSRPRGSCGPTHPCLPSSSWSGRGLRGLLRDLQVQGPGGHGRHARRLHRPR